MTNPKSPPPAHTQATIRACLFFVVFYPYMIAAVVIGTCMIPFPRRVIEVFGQNWVRGFFRLMGWFSVPCQVEGLEKITARKGGAVLLAVKHQSLWETMCLPHLIPGAVMVVKRELLWIPFFGWTLWKLGAIGINRASGTASLRQMLGQARAFAQQERVIVIFPEGTRTKPGEQVPYQPGIAALYKHLEIPCLPAVLNSGVRWPRRRLALYKGAICLRFLDFIPPGLASRDFLARLAERMESEAARLPLV